MRKLFSSLIVGIFAVAMTAGAAMGSTIAIADAANGVTDYRLCAGVAYTLSSAAGGNHVPATNIEYTSTVPLPVASILQFTLSSGAKFPAATYWLVTAAGAQMGTKVLGAPSASVAMNTDTTPIANGDAIYLIEANAIAAPIAANMPPVIVAQGTASGTKITVACDRAVNGTTSLDVPGGLAPAVDLYAISDGLNLAIADNAANVIDVNNERKIFEALPDTVTTSDVALTLDVDGAADDVKNVITANDAVDSYTLTITGNLVGVDTITVPDMVGSPHTVTDAERTAGEVVLTGAGDAPDWTVAKDITLTLFGVDDRVVLDTRQFTYSFSFTDSASSVTTALKTNANMVAWTINGYQAVYPYFNTRNTYGSYIILSNSSAAAADVVWDITASSNAAVSGNLGDYTNKQVTGGETLAAGESRLYTNAELVDAFGLDAIDAKRNVIKVTITAPVASVVGTAFMEDPGSGGKRSMPLLTNGDDYKQW